MSQSERISKIGVRRQYSAHFKRGLIKQVQDGKRPSIVSRDAGIPFSTLHNWMKAANGDRRDKSLLFADALTKIDQLFDTAKMSRNALDRKNLNSIHRQIKKILEGVTVSKVIF